MRNPKKKKFNKAVESIPVAVTDAAYAASAPSTSAAHLVRSATGAMTKAP